MCKMHSGGGSQPSFTFLRTLLCAASCVLVASVALASDAGFVYVVLPGSPAHVEVFDASTIARVTVINRPGAAAPYGAAMSPDGTRLYVSIRAADAGAISVIDARHHTLLRTYPLGTSQYGRIAVSADGGRVFLLRGDNTTSILEAFDTSSHTITASRLFSGRPVDIAVNVLTNDVLVLVSEGFNTPLTACDSISLAPRAAAEWVGGYDARQRGLSVSRDGTRVHVLHGKELYSNPLFTDDVDSIFDAASLALSRKYSLLVQANSFIGLSRPVEISRTHEVVVAGNALGPAATGPYRPYLGRTSLLDASISLVALPQSPSWTTGPSTVAPLETRVFTMFGSSSAASLLAIDLDAAAIVGSVPLETISDLLVSTPAGAQSCTYRLDSNYSSWPNAKRGDALIPGPSSAGSPASARART